MTSRFAAITTLAALALTLSGCSQQTINSAGQDAQRDATVANSKAQQIARDAKPQLHKLGLGARVTAALHANANLPPTIRVDAGDNGVRLKGTVRSRAQKKLAGRIAAETLAPGQTVNNALTVQGE